eukprot:3385551-Prorocentrum_lima.AAC.1
MAASEKTASLSEHLEIFATAGLLLEWPSRVEKKPAVALAYQQHRGWLVGAICRSNQPLRWYRVRA